MAGRQVEGERLLGGVGDDLGARGPGRPERRRQGVGVGLQAVVEGGGAVAEAEAEQVDQEGAGAGEQRVGGRRREVGG